MARPEHRRAAELNIYKQTKQLSSTAVSALRIYVAHLENIPKQNIYTQIFIDFNEHFGETFNFDR